MQLFCLTYWPFDLIKKNFYSSKVGWLNSNNSTTKNIIINKLIFLIFNLVYTKPESLTLMHCLCIQGWLSTNTLVGHLITEYNSCVEILINKKLMLLHCWNLWVLMTPPCPADNSFLSLTSPPRPLHYLTSIVRWLFSVGGSFF